MRSPARARSTRSVISSQFIARLTRLDPCEKIVQPPRKAPARQGSAIGSRQNLHMLWGQRLRCGRKRNDRLIEPVNRRRNSPRTGQGRIKPGTFAIRTAWERRKGADGGEEKVER